MVIQQIRNATLKIEYGNITFLIDPWLQDQGTGFSAKAIQPEMQGVRCPMNALPDSPEIILKGVDYCLVTHLHFDHFSPDYLPQDLKIIAQNQADSEKLQQMGFKNTTAFASESVTVGDVVIHKTKAVHGDSSELVEKMGEVCGYVFEAPGEKCLYLAADTVSGATVIASHLDSVNHALLTRKDITAFAKEKDLTGIQVPEDGECIAF